MVTIRFRQVCGFTLIELIVVLSIVLAVLGLGVPKMVSGMRVVEFRRGVVQTMSFLRQSHLDAVAEGSLLSIRLEGDVLTRSDGKALSPPKGLQFSLPPDSRDRTMVVFSPGGRSSGQTFFITGTHKRKAVISIDPLTGMPKCRYN